MFVEEWHKSPNHIDYLHTLNMKSNFLLTRVFIIYVLRLTHDHIPLKQSCLNHGIVKIKHVYLSWFSKTYSKRISRKLFIWWCGHNSLIAHYVVCFADIEFWILKWGLRVGSSQPLVTVLHLKATPKFDYVSHTKVGSHGVPSPKSRVWHGCLHGNNFWRRGLELLLRDGLCKKLPPTLNIPLQFVLHRIIKIWLQW